MESSDPSDNGVSMERIDPPDPRDLDHYDDEEFSMAEVSLVPETQLDLRGKGGYASGVNQ